MPSPPPDAGIVVLGAPRSGTTLLRRLLNAHPKINCPPETNLLSAAARFVHEESFAGGMAVGVVPGLGFSQFTEEQILERLRTMVVGILQQIAADAGKPVWAEKTAFDSFHIEQIERILGDRVRYVCLVRHPLDVACSIKELTDKMELVVDELRPYLARFASPYEAFTQAWVDIVQSIVKLIGRHPDAAIQLRYEDLVADPVEQLSRLFDFLQQPTDARVLVDQAMHQQDTVGLGDWKTYQKSSISAGSVGRWKSLSATTVARMARIAGTTLVKMGYEPLATGDQASDAEARRQYKIGLMAARLTASARPKQENRP
jgi:hypothetical protein